MLNSNMPVLQKSGAGLIHNFTLKRGTLFEISYFLYLQKKSITQILINLTCFFLISSETMWKTIIHRQY